MSRDGEYKSTFERDTSSTTDDRRLFNSVWQLMIIVLALSQSKIKELREVQILVYEGWRFRMGWRVPTC